MYNSLGACGIPPFSQINNGYGGRRSKFLCVVLFICLSERFHRFAANFNFKSSHTRQHRHASAQSTLICAPIPWSACPNSNDRLNSIVGGIGNYLDLRKKNDALSVRRFFGLPYANEASASSRLSASLASCFDCDFFDCLALAVLASRSSHLPFGSSARGTSKCWCFLVVIRF